jgi:hypothetical protein
LDDEERKLLKRLKPYFGSKKKPTLQSLAMNLLNEEGNGKGFSGRTLYHYLDAVRQYRQKKGRAAFSFTFLAVESFGMKESKTVRQSIYDMEQTIIETAQYISSYVQAMADHLIKPYDLFGGQLPFIIETGAASRAIGAIIGNLESYRPVMDFGAIAKALGSEIFPRINLYKNLQS